MIFLRLRCNPTNGTWSGSGDLSVGRYHHTATLLPSGKILIAGGESALGASASAELYDVGTGFVRPDWQPQITTANVVSGNILVLAGSRFRGISQASGGNFQDSSSNYPLLQLRNIENSETAYLTVDPIAGWSDTSFTSTPTSNFASGPALVSIFANGIPSDSKYLVIGGGGTPAPSPTPTASPTPSSTPAATPTATSSPTPTPVGTSTPTATPSVTPTSTPSPTSTPRITPTPRTQPTPRPRATPAPRP